MHTTIYRPFTRKKAAFWKQIVSQLGGGWPPHHPFKSATAYKPCVRKRLGAFGILAHWPAPTLLRHCFYCWLFFTLHPDIPRRCEDAASWRRCRLLRKRPTQSSTGEQQTPSSLQRRLPLIATTPFTCRACDEMTVCENCNAGKYRNAIRFESVAFCMLTFRRTDRKKNR